MARNKRLNSITTGLVAMLAAGGLVVASSSPASSAAWSAGELALGVDRILMRDGRVLEGTIVDQNERTVSIKLLIRGMQSQVPTHFNMSDVLRIDRAEAAADPAPAPDRPAEVRPGGGVAAVPAEGATRVYHLRLTGEFGRDITQTPILSAVQDAARQGAQIIIVEVDNRWQANRFQQKAEDEHAFDEFWRAKDIWPVFTTNLPNLFEYERPRVVMWVRNAMGGAAFLPFMSREIYFAPNGRMGGIGDLDTYFQGIDPSVRDKQQSLRLADARGVALANGYEPRLIDAMTMTPFVLSVSFRTGRPEYHEGMPRPEYFEELLTDDGQGENKDSDADVVRGLGNDCLTLHAPMALKLNVSRGTAATLDELLFQLGVSRNHVMVSDRADRIMSDWSRGLDDALRTFRRIMNQELPEARGAEGGGTWEQRNRARGRQRTLIESVLGLIRRYQEVLDPGGQAQAQLELELEAIRLRSISDRR